MKKFYLRSIVIFIMVITGYLGSAHAQESRMSDSQCGRAVLLGETFEFVPVEGAERYEYHMYSNDSVYNRIFSSVYPRFHVKEGMHIPLYEPLNVRVRTYTADGWSSYGEACQFKIVLECGHEKFLRENITTPREYEMLREYRNNLSTTYESPDSLPEAGIYTIPVVFHVMVPRHHTGSPMDYISPDRINETLGMLNGIYAGNTSHSPESHDTRIRFCPAGSYELPGGGTNGLVCYYRGSNYYGITYNSGNNQSINLPQSLASLNHLPSIPYSSYTVPYSEYFPDDKYLNVWIFESLYAPGISGFAWSRALDHIDNTTPGVIAIKADYIRATSMDYPLFTVAHEIGHYFGLEHTWGITDMNSDPATNLGCDPGDFIDDTPPHNYPTMSCEQTPSMCGEGIFAPVENIMNYSPHGCREHFSPGQSIHMRASIRRYFPELPVTDNPPEDYVYCEPIPNMSHAHILFPAEQLRCGGKVVISVFTQDAAEFRVEITDQYDNIVDVLYGRYFISCNYDYPYPYYCSALDLDEPGIYNISLILENGNAEPYRITKSIEIIECEEYSLTGTQGAQWHFDENAGLDFRSGLAQLGYSLINAGVSETSVCAQDGKLLFYTNGEQIWDGNHMLQPIGLGGNMGNSKSVIAIPISSTPSYLRYMVVFTGSDDKLRYKIIGVDMPQGRLNIPGESSLLVTSGGYATLKSMGVSACPKTDGSGYWLLTSFQDNPSSNTYLPSSIEINFDSPTDASNIQSFGQGIQATNSNGSKITIKVSPNGKFVNYNKPYGDNILLQFNAGNGKFLMKLNCNIQNSSLKNYDVEFSESSRFMYMYELDVTGEGGNKHCILQIDLNNINLCSCNLPSDIIFEAREVDDETYLLSSMSLQRGPDGRIYFSRNSDIRENARFTGVVMEPEIAANHDRFDNECGVLDRFIEYSGYSSLRNRTYLPNLIDAAPEDCDLDFRACMAGCDSTLVIYNLSHGDEESFHWLFSNGTDTWSYNGYTPSVFDTLPYSESWRVILSKTGCGEKITQDITIVTTPEVNISGGLTICANNSNHIFSIRDTARYGIVSAGWNLEGIGTRQGLSFDINGQELTRFAGDSIRLTVNVANHFGCTAEETFYLHVEEIEYYPHVSYECSNEEGFFSLEILGDDNEQYSATVNGYDYPVSNGMNRFFRGLSTGEHNYTLSGLSCNYEGSFTVEYPTGLDYILEKVGCDAWYLRFLFNPGQTGFEFRINGQYVESHGGAFYFVTSGDVVYSNSVPHITLPGLLSEDQFISVDITTREECPFNKVILLPKVSDIYFNTYLRGVRPYYCGQRKGELFLRAMGEPNNTVNPVRITNTTTLEILDLGDHMNMMHDLVDGDIYYFYGLDAGFYEVLFTGQSQCSQSYSFEIPDSTVTITPQVIYSCEDPQSNTISLYIRSDNGSSVVWQIGRTTVEIVSEMVRPGLYRNVLSGIREGTYRYIFNGEDGCSLEGEVRVYLSEVSLTAGIGQSPGCMAVGNTTGYFYPSGINESEWGNFSYIWYLNNRPSAIGARFIPDFEDSGYNCIKLELRMNSCITTSETQVYAYESDCYCDAGNYDYEEIIITDNQVWNDSTLWILGNLEVMPDAMLELKDCELHFGPAGKVIIHEKARLGSNNSTFTSFKLEGCNEMWQGIEVAGPPLSDPYRFWQGTLDLSSSTVENAHIGVLVGTRDMACICSGSRQVFDPSGGGMLSVGNSKLWNNGIHIKILPKSPRIRSSDILINTTEFTGGRLPDNRYDLRYDNPYGFYDRRNPWIRGANFSARTFAGIDAEGIRGIKINRCDFSFMEVCIYSMDAKYNVSECNFTKAGNGIYILNSVSGLENSHEIFRNTFDMIPGANSRPISNMTKPQHIYISGGKYDYIYDNSFGNLLSDLDYSNYGIYMNSSSGFNIIENDFWYLKKGITINNSGSTGGFVGAGLSTKHLNWRGNIYNFCSTNIHTSGNNPKLTLKCNMCYNDDANIYFTNFDTYGILGNQGASSLSMERQSTRKPAGNEFDGNAGNPKKIISRNSSYNYYHHISPETTIPDVSFSSAPIYTYGNPNSIKTSNAGSCPPVSSIIIDVREVMSSSLLDGCIKKLDSLSDEIRYREIELASIRNNFDNGQTYKLLDDYIYSNLSPDIITKMLLDYSPLSDTVLIALIIEFPLSNDYFHMVMTQNMPVSKNVEPYLLERIRYNPDILGNLLELQAYNPYNERAYRNMENEINYLKTERRQLLNNIMCSPGMIDLYKENAIELLESENDVSTDMDIVSTFIYSGEYERARDKIKNMEHMPETDKNWYIYQNLLLDLFMDNRNFYNMNDKELSILKDIAYDCPVTLSVSNARSVLEYYYGEFFKECEEVDARSSRFIDPGIFNKVPVSNAYISENYPDPFSDITSIDYFIPEGSTGTIFINDIYGRRICEYDVFEGENTLKIDASGFSQGIYTYGLVVNGNIIDYKKMVITK